jgi:hypothetical protein
LIFLLNLNKSKIDLNQSRFDLKQSGLDLKQSFIIRFGFSGPTSYPFEYPWVSRVSGLDLQVTHPSCTDLLGQVWVGASSGSERVGAVQNGFILGRVSTDSESNTRQVRGGYCGKNET